MRRWRIVNSINLGSTLKKVDLKLLQPWLVVFKKILSEGGFNAHKYILTGLFVNRRCTVCSLFSKTEIVYPHKFSSQMLRNPGLAKEDSSPQRKGVQPGSWEGCPSPDWRTMSSTDYCYLIRRGEDGSSLANFEQAPEKYSNVTIQLCHSRQRT